MQHDVGLEYETVNQEYVLVPDSIAQLILDTKECASESIRSDLQNNVRIISKLNALEIIDKIVTQAKNNSSLTTNTIAYEALSNACTAYVNAIVDGSVMVDYDAQRSPCSNSKVFRNITVLNSITANCLTVYNNARFENIFANNGTFAGDVIINGCLTANCFNPSLQNQICIQSCTELLFIPSGDTLTATLATPDPLYSRVVSVFDATAPRALRVPGVDYRATATSPTTTDIQNLIGAPVNWRVNTFYNTCNISCTDSTPVIGNHLSCNWLTIDNLESGARAVGGFATSNGTITSSDGIVYTITSFIINGVEQLTAPFYYTIINPGVITLLPNPHDPIILNYNSIDYLANYNLIFGELFQSLGISNDWQALLNPNGLDIMTLIWPMSATSWSIEVLRHDGTIYTYYSNGNVVSQNGFESINTAYYYCSGGPTVVNLAATQTATCDYVAWDITRLPYNGGYPITWTVNLFAVNGNTLFSGAYSYIINNPGDLVFQNIGDTYYINNSIFLNNFFASIGLGSSWSATTVDHNTLQISYPNNTSQFTLGIIRNNGQQYYYQVDGFVTSVQGFNSTNAGYSDVCASSPLRTVAIRTPQKGTRLTSAQELKLIKSKKKVTPLTIPAPLASQDIQGVLYERIKTVWDMLSHKLEHFELYLFGSQAKGYSASGSPDIDLWLVTPETTRNTSRMLLDQIVMDLDFKLDITHVDASVINNRAIAIKFIPHGN